MTHLPTPALPKERPLARRRQGYARALPARWRQRGISALEFAIVAPLVLIMILAPVEFLLVMMADVRLEAAVTRAEREARYTWPQSGVQRNCSEAIGQVVRDNLGSWVISQTVIVQEADSYPRALQNPTLAPCTDVPTGWVSYTVGLTQAGVLGIVPQLANLSLQRTLVVRNLP